MVISDLVPLTGPECDLLPMHFFVDPGPKVNWANLSEDRCSMRNVITSIEKYLDVKNIPLDQIEAGGLLSEDSLSSSDSASVSSASQILSASVDVLGFLFLILRFILYSLVYFEISVVYF